MPISKPLPPADVLHRLFSYEPETGLLTRRENGKLCAAQTGHGYIRICPYCAHKHGDAWEITGNEEREQRKDCEGCGKEFKCWADVSIWYAAEAIEPSPPPGGGG